MPQTTNTRDRVIALETRVDTMAAEIDDIQAKVNAMHDLLMKASGAKWLAIGLGGFAVAMWTMFAGKIAAIMAWFGWLPR